MASKLCGYCGKHTHMTPVKLEQTSTVTGTYRYSGTYECDNCGQWSVANGHSASAFGHSQPHIDNFLDSSGAWHPRKGESRQFPDVPADIANAASEAFECASINANHASILMARTVVEATAKAKGITSGNLMTKIDQMRDQNLIRPDIAAVAHEIRFMGNNMAHGDLDDDVTSDDAADILALMSQILSEVFQGPALLAAVAARRQERGGRASSQQQ